MDSKRKNGEHYLRPRWRAMLARCENPKNKRYERYGARGITVCGRWHTFAHWLADMGEPTPPTLSLERIDNDGPYEPGNCTWATPIEQRQNREDYWTVELDGRQQSQAQWEREFGLYPGAICNRAERGWMLEDAILTPAAPNPPRILTYEGQSLPMAEWVRRTGIPETTLSSRIRRGWPVDKALSTPPAFLPRLIEFGGECHSISDWSRRLGIDRATLSQRLRHGWSVERTLTEPLLLNQTGKPKFPKPASHRAS